MKLSKGFTLVEMVMGLLLVGLIIMVAMAFMILQSRYGRVAAGQRSAREVVALSLNMIAKDVRQAGYGLGDTISDSSINPAAPTAIDTFNLAILPDTEVTQMWEDGLTHRCYTRLFIQYGMYLANDPTPTMQDLPDPTLKTNPHIFSALSPDTCPAAPAAWTSPRFGKPNSAVLVYPFALTPELNLAASTTLNRVKGSLKDGQIGGLIGYNFNVGTNRQRSILVSYDSTASQYDLASATESNTYYAPAVVYTYHGQPDYEIRRNGVSLTAGRNDMRITGFCVQATFWDTTMAPAQEIQVPGALGTQKFETFVSPNRPNLRDLRSMMITVRYKIRQAIPRSSGPDADSERVWTVAPELKRTVVVAPRAIVTQAALTQQTPLANPTDY